MYYCLATCLRCAREVHVPMRIERSYDSYPREKLVDVPFVDECEECVFWERLDLD